MNKVKPTAGSIYLNKKITFENEGEKNRSDLIISSIVGVSDHTKDAEQIGQLTKIARGITSRKNFEAELMIANKELASQKEGKGKLAVELIIAKKELAYQKQEKEKRATEFLILNDKLPDSKKNYLFFQGGGEMGELMINYDWSKTVLGSPDGWPQSLRTTVSNLLKSKFPMFLFWGKDLTQFYNDAYRPSLGNNGKHPRALGQNGEECWPEIWYFIEPLIKQVQTTGEATWSEDQLLPIYRNGHMEDVYWTFSYSCALDDYGKSAGVLVTCIETTDKILNLMQLKESKDQLEFANKKLAFQNKEKEERTAELGIANKELDYQNDQKEKQAEELVVANKELAFQNEEKEKRAAELLIANNELAFQNEEKEKRATELVIANKELAFQNEEKEKRANELVIANKELAFQNEEKGKRAAELLIANIELAFQNQEKEKRAAELLIANKELAFQNQEKEKRAAELLSANGMLAIQNVKQLKEVSGYKHALDESSILAITDQKGIINHVNDNFCKISKYSADELIGQDHRIINSGYHSKEYLQNLWVTIAHGKVWKGELKNKAKDGTIYWVDTTIVPFLNEQGKPYQYAAIRIDITLRKQAEEEVRILNEDLEKRVKERTEDLESFSYSVSHDLRAPIRAVNGFTRMLKNKYGIQLDQEANRLIDNIVVNATKIGQLIDDLLAFSRLSRREMTLMQIPMLNLVTNICRELKNEQDDRQIEFRIGKLIPVQADNTGIKQVWLNLISNAVKYSRLKDKAIIEIGSEIKGEEIIYYVKDNGAGFDMRYVNKLFKTFQRLHSDEEFEGTGIGLAIVHRIIHKHGGRVWAEGEPNEGAVFYFSLNKSQVP